MASLTLRPLQAFQTIEGWGQVHDFYPLTMQQSEFFWSPTGMCRINYTKNTAMVANFDSMISPQPTPDGGGLRSNDIFRQYGQHTHYMYQFLQERNDPRFVAMTESDKSGLHFKPNDPLYNPNDSAMKRVICRVD